MISIFTHPFAKTEKRGAELRSQPSASSKLLQAARRCAAVSLGLLALTSLGTASSSVKAFETATLETAESSSLVAAALPESPQGGAPKVASGTYLFGDTPEAGQPGHEYMVIRVNGNRVVGGFYQPYSEFSCFSGSVTPDELTLQVQETYGPEVSTYSVPLYLDNRVAAAEFVMPFENALGLQGTYRIDEMDDVSQRVLDSCSSERP